jgi:RNA-binding protein Musashi
MSGSASPGPSQQQSGFNAQEQMVFEQQKYERQQMARMQGQNVNGGSTWEGMYDDVPAPAGVNNRGGGFAGRGGRGGAAARGGSATPGNAPVGAPTGPKNAGMPGSNYRGGGRGGRGGGGGGGAGGRFDPYARNAK